MDAEVYWNGNLIGHLRDIVIDQPYYLGNWTSTGNTEFTNAYREMQTKITPNGLGILPVTFSSSDGTVTTPAAAIIRPAPETAPYFRFGQDGLTSGILVQPTSKWGW